LRMNQVLRCSGVEVSGIEGLREEQRRTRMADIPAIPADETCLGLIQIAIGIGIGIDISWDRETGKLKQTAPSRPMGEIDRPADALISIPIAIPIWIPIQPKYRRKHSIKKRFLLLCGFAPLRETGFCDSILPANLSLRVRRGFPG